MISLTATFFVNVESVMTSVAPASTKAAPPEAPGWFLAKQEGNSVKDNQYDGVGN